VLTLLQTSRTARTLFTIVNAMWVTTRTAGAARGDSYPVCGDGY